MLAMARALMPDPEVLLLDEPSAGLSPRFVDAMFEKIAEINATGVPILMVEQNARRALAHVASRIRARSRHATVSKARAPTSSHDPKVIDLYLGGTGRIDA